MENTAHGRGVLAEHGLSFLIGEDGHRTLFDTGEGSAIRDNAAKFHVDLSSVDTLVLSHGHYDYTGGVVCLPAKRTPRPVYVHPAAPSRASSLCMKTVKWMMWGCRRRAARHS
ncbi:MAG: MBL fold metallo-hydrolase [Spirochaetia bacterium]